MIIYFKCSFRSSHGFTLSKYDSETKQLCYISEKNADTSSVIPKTIEYTLSHQLGQCVVLGTDENGNLFLGVYRLIEGNDDKYVNAVFYDKDEPKNLLALYEYFGTKHYSAVLKLLDSVERANRKADSDF